jgi:hypothetical protein
VRVRACMTTMAVDLLRLFRFRPHSIDIAYVDEVSFGNIIGFGVADLFEAL